MERAVQFRNALSLLIIVIAEENITDCSLEQALKHPGGIDVIELLEKSNVPDKFAQSLNGTPPSVLNDIGANNSNPVPLQFWKAPAPIDVILEEKDATSLWQRLNAFAPMVVNGIALRFVMVVRFEQSLNASVPIDASRLVEFRDTRMRLVRF